MKEEIEQELKQLFNDLIDHGVEPLTIQLVTLEARQGQLVSHIHGKDEKVTQKYWEASKKFIFGDSKADEERQIVRSLVYTKPDDIAYVSVFGKNKLIGYLRYIWRSITSRWTEKSSEMEKWDRGNYFYQPVPDTDLVKNLKTMRAPPGYDEATRKNLIEHYCECLSEHLLAGESLGTLIWLYNVASEDETASLFAVFAGRMGKRENEIIHLLNEFLQKRTVRHYTGRLKKRAVQTAITNIFARNFAHNIGSHVAINSANQKIRRRIDDLYDDDISSGSPQARGWLDYMTERLKQYQVHRNEYLADFLNQSPIPMRLYRDLVLDFAENAILMDNLAKSERICYERRGDDCVRNRLRIRTFIEGKEIQCRYPSAQDTGACGEEVVYPEAFPYLVQLQEDNIGIEKAYNDKLVSWADGGDGEPDVEVIVTNPHAFYSILENFIRNSAKHCEDTLQRDEGPNDLEVYLSVDEEDESYSIAIHDNVSVVDLEKALHFQKNAIEGSLLGDDLEPTRENSGIADMKVNAFLLSMPSEALSDDALKKKMEIVVCAENCEGPSEREFQGLREFRSEDDKAEREVDDASRPISELKEDIGERVYFGYQFEILKPKKVCWVGSHDTELDTRSTELRRNGLSFHDSPDAYFDSLQGASLASHDFVVLQEKAVHEWLDEGEGEEVQPRLDQLLLTLPCRVLLVGEGEDRPEELADAVRQRRVVKVDPEQDLLAGVSDGETAAEIANDLLRRCWHAWLTRWDVKEENGAHGYVYALDEDTVDAWQWNGERLSKQLGPVAFSIVWIEDSLKRDEEGRVIADNRKRIPNDGRLVVYDRHGNFKTVVEDVPSHENTYRDEVAPRLRKTESYNLFDKKSPDFARINYPPEDDELREFLAYKMIEAGLIRVLIIDERIADFNEGDMNNQARYIAQSKSNTLHSHAEGWRDKVFWNQAVASNVFVATHLQFGENDAQPVGSNDKKRLKVTLEKAEEGETGEVSIKTYNTEIDHNLFDVVVVHRTRFVDMRDGIARPAEDKTEAAARLVNQLRTCASFVVIDSGGGKPHGIDESLPYRFLPYSKLDGCFSGSIESGTISKLKLAEQLLALRRNEKDSL